MIPVLPDPVVVERAGDDLLVRFNRPSRHNAFSTDMRAALLEALSIAIPGSFRDQRGAQRKWPILLQRR